MQLGQPIVYRVPDDRHMTTQKHDKSTVQGSAYHPEIVEFAGVVAYVSDDGKFDIVIFPPNRSLTTVNNVAGEDLRDPTAAAFAKGMQSSGGGSGGKSGKDSPGHKRGD